MLIEESDSIFKIQINETLQNDRKYLSTNDDGSNVDLWTSYGQKQQWRLDLFKIIVDDLVYDNANAKFKEIVENNDRKE